MCVCFELVEGVLFGGGPVFDVWEGWHRIGQTKAFPRVTPVRKVGPSDLAGRMAQKGAHPRVGPIRKVAPAELDGALWPGRGLSGAFWQPFGQAGRIFGLPGKHIGSWGPAFRGSGSSKSEF